MLFFSLYNVGIFEGSENISMLSVNFISFSVISISFLYIIYLFFSSVLSDFYRLSIFPHFTYPHYL